MKQFWKEICFCVILTVLVPTLLLNTVRITDIPGSTAEHLPQFTTVPSVTEPKPTLTVRVLQEDGSVVPMDLEEYLIGVIFGEMSADFEPEALKAQAVVARTYVLRNREMGSKHPNAHVCVRSECCQSYKISRSEEQIQKIRAAVEATAGQVLTYEGRLIEATYFSSSGGRTEDAVAVWGNEVPYLQSVESPEGEQAQALAQTVTMSLQEFLDRLGISREDADPLFPGDITYTQGGGVDTMTIGKQVFRGTELRQLLGLRSTVFQITRNGDQITLSTKGYGHRVGMSQYGAEAMAVDGASYGEILAHYYPGTRLEEFVDKD